MNTKMFMPFIDPRLKVGWNDSLGYGIFTSDDVKSGEFLEVAPVILLDRMPEDVDLAKYVIAWGGKIAVPFGWTMFYNHSDDNCCEFSANINEGLLAIIAKRDIKAQTQITVNYGPSWFSSRNIKKVPL